MVETTIELIDGLVERVPALRPLLREHFADHFGEVLPHVFFGDLSRHVIKEWGRAGADGVQPILVELESAFAAGDEEAAELIAVSFLENLPRPGEPGHEVRRLLGPRLRSELDRMGI